MKREHGLAFPSTRLFWFIFLSMRTCGRFTVIPTFRVALPFCANTVGTRSNYFREKRTREGTKKQQNNYARKEASLKKKLYLLFKSDSSLLQAPLLVSIVSSISSSLKQCMSQLSQCMSQLTRL